MSSRRVTTTFIVASILSGMLIAVSAVAPAALAAVPGPTVDSPSDGQTINYNGDLAVHVEPVEGASGYLYGFFQNSDMVWENYANERHLSGTDYNISVNTPGHAAIQPGHSRFGCAR